MTALAAVFVQRPAVIVLDEPTLSCYRGAVLVASHDVPFLRSIGITRWLRLERGARLRTSDPL
jgi:ATPase subunit of ABC transporter with duplicated ATPase domains